MLESLKETLTRRRALIITPFAFAGLMAVTSRKGKISAASPEVTIIPFDDAGHAQPASTIKRVVHTDAEWKSLLTNNQFYVTRKEATDRAFTGTFYKMHEHGMFRCVCCGNAVYHTDTKFDSGTGWPSFWAPIAKENVSERRDTSFGMERVEVHCTECLAHLGHVFDDGPKPTGLRHCINESSLKFVKI